jgi:nitrogen fixation/metabolism regulation signal transduction histidine kinase
MFRTQTADQNGVRISNACSRDRHVSSPETARPECWATHDPGERPCCVFGNCFDHGLRRLLWHSKHQTRRRTGPHDQSLMSINYARAAQADFEGMRAAFARNLRTRAPDEHAANQLIQLEQSLKEDLAVAAQRSQSLRAKASADRARAAVVSWISQTNALALSRSPQSKWDDIDSLAETVSEEIDLLINYTAGDGFLYRQAAAATVERDVQLNFAGALAALILCGLVGWLLTRRMVTPVAAASAAAKCIASGKLDVEIPSGGGDELG